MKVFHLKQEVLVPRPLAEVFAFFSKAENLNELTPGDVRFAMVTPTPIQMRVGLTIDYRLRIRGVPLTWQSEILEWQPPHRFVDEQRRGPYAYFRHEHRFVEVEGGTLVVDELSYALPLGPLGVLAHGLFVRRDIERIFAYREKRMREIFG